MTATERPVRAAILEEAALLADAFEDENLRMAGDTILLDPVLAKFRTQRGHTITPDDWRACEGHQLDGTIHSAMAQAARNIAAGIRALANRPEPIREKP